MAKQTLLGNLAVNAMATGTNGGLVGLYTGGSADLRTGAAPGPDNAAGGIIVATFPVLSVSNANGVLTLGLGPAAAIAAVSNIGDGTTGTNQVHLRFKNSAGTGFAEMSAGPDDTFSVNLGAVAIAINDQITISAPTHTIRKSTTGY